MARRSGSVVVLLLFMLASAMCAQARAQGRALSVPGEAANVPRFAVPPAAIPGSWSDSPGYGGLGSCTQRLQKQQELNALLQKKIDLLEARLGELQNKVAKGER